MPHASPRKPESPGEFEDFPPFGRGRNASAGASAALLLAALIVVVGWRLSIHSLSTGAGAGAGSVDVPTGSVSAEGDARNDGVVVKKLNLMVADDGRGGAVIREVGPVRFGTDVRWLSTGDRVVGFNTHLVSSCEDLAARVEAASGRTTIDVVEEKDDVKRTLVVLLPERELRTTTVELRLDRR